MNDQRPDGTDDHDGVQDEAHEGPRDEERSEQPDDDATAEVPVDADEPTRTDGPAVTESGPATAAFWGTFAQDEDDRHERGAQDDPAGSVGSVGDGSTVEEPRRRRRGLVVLAGVAVLLGGLYVAGYFLTGSRLPADASVAGVDLGGMSPAEAESALEAGTEDRLGTPIVLQHEEETFEVVPQDAGLVLDVAASVDQAGGARTWDPRDMLALVVGGDETAPVLDVDEAALESAVGAISEAVDVPVREARISFPEAQPEPREPRAGLQVVGDEAEQSVRDAYLVADEPVTVPTATVEPMVDSEGLRTALTEIAEPAVSAPVTIAVGDDTIELPVTAYAPALSVDAVDGAMVPVIDPERLEGPLTDASTGIGRKAVDATVRIEGDRPVVVPGEEGVGLQSEEMAEKLVPVLTETGDARRVEIEAKVVEPQFTTEDAEALGITEKISEFTTEYPHADYRNVNQGRAAEILDGTILEPGDTFSFNDTVGERTEANGFTTGSVINGGRFRDELGGGVSQVVTTTYNAAFFAGLDDVEHHPHAFYIDRYPVGREATVYFGSLDLRFRNNLESGVLIRAFVQPSSPGGVGRTTVQMWGTKEFDVEAGESPRRNFRTPNTRYDDSAACVPQAPLQGFDIDIIRVLRQDGEVVKRETDTAVYQAADRIVCGPQPGSRGGDRDDED